MRRKEISKQQLASNLQNYIQFKKAKGEPVSDELMALIEGKTLTEDSDLSVSYAEDVECNSILS